MSTPITKDPGPDVALASFLKDPRLFDSRLAVVLEHGVVLSRVDDNRWEYQGKESRETGSLEDALSVLGLRVVRLKTRINPQYVGEFTLPASGSGGMLEYQVQQLGQYQVLNVDPKYTTAVLHIAYIAEATVHHCRRLISEYVNVLCWAIPREGSAPIVSEDFLYSGAVAPYFEFEALVTASVRSYDTLRFPIWSAFGSKGTTPSNFGRTVDGINAPSAMQSVLAEAANAYARVKDYRDCIQHYAHFGARMPFARVQLRRGAAWSVVALLPDNPEAKSYPRFSYDSNLDALTYGWTIASSTVRHISEIVGALPRRAD